MLLLVPLDIKPPAAIRKFLEFSVETTKSYFPITVVFEDRDAFVPGTAYLIGARPVFIARLKQ